MRKILIITFMLVNVCSFFTNDKLIIGTQTALAQHMAKENDGDEFYSGGNLPSVPCVGDKPGDKTDIAGSYWDIYNTLNGGNALGGDTEVVVTAPYPSGGISSSGTSAPSININTNISTNDIIIIDDCVTYLTEFGIAKQEALSIMDKYLSAQAFKVGQNQYISWETYNTMVDYDCHNEYTTVLYDYSQDGYSIGLSQPEKGTTNEDKFTYIQSSASTAIIHNHPNQTCVSPQDIITLLNVHTVCPNLKTIIAWDYDYQYYYCATITDESKAQAFHDRFKDSVGADHDWNNNDIREMQKYFNKDYSALANSVDSYNTVGVYMMQSVLDYFDSGISLTIIAKREEGNLATSLKTKISAKKIEFIKCGNLN